MRAFVIITIWVLLLSAVILIGNIECVAFWIAFAAFGLLSVYIEKHQKELSRDLDEFEEDKKWLK